MSYYSTTEGRRGLLGRCVHAGRLEPPVGGQEQLLDKEPLGALHRDATRAAFPGGWVNSLIMSLIYRVVRAERFRLSRFLGSARGALIAAAVAPRVALAAGRRSSVALALKAKNIGRRYAGDRALLRNGLPGGPGCDTAAVSFTLNRAATVKLEVVHTARRTTSVAWKTEKRLPAGSALVDLDARHRDARGLLRDAADHRPEWIRDDGPGRQAPAVDRQAAGTVVRVLGVEAVFLRRSYLPGEPMELRILADAGALTLSVPPRWCRVHEQRAQRRDGRRAQRATRCRSTGPASGRRRPRSPFRPARGRPASTRPS